MLMTIAGLMLLDPALAAADAPVPAGDRTIACIERHIPANALARLAGALDAEVDEVPAEVEAVILKLLQHCLDNRDEDPLLICVGFGHVLMAGHRDLIAARAGLSSDRRLGFAAAVQPFADGLTVPPDGSALSSEAISDAMLAEVRSALAGAGFAMPISDRDLRTYIELLARERAVRARLNRLPADGGQASFVADAGAPRSMNKRAAQSAAPAITSPAITSTR